MAHHFQTFFIENKIASTRFKFKAAATLKCFKRDNNEARIV